MPPMTISDSDTWNEKKKEAQAAGKVIVVDFWATWCGPCKVIGPKFEELSDDPAYADLVFAKVDVDECPQVAEEAGVQAMPTIQVWFNGEKFDEIVGASKDKLAALVQRAKDKQGS